MTTKVKIIAGFLTMIALLAAMSYMGFRVSRSTSGILSEYDRLATVNVATSDLDGSMNRISSELVIYVGTLNEEAMKRSRAAVNDALRHIATAGERFADEGRKTILANLSQVVTGLHAMQDQIQTGLQKSTTIYADMRTNSAELATALGSLAQQARSTNDSDVMLGLTEIWDNFATLRASLSRYAESRDPADIATVDTQFDAISTVLAHLRDTASASSRQALNTATDRYTLYTEGYEQLVKTNTAVQGIIVSLENTLTDQVRLARELNADVDKFMVNFADRTRDEVASNQKNILIIAVVGVLFGLIIAGFIVFGLIHVLTDLGTYAREIARGNFKYTSSVTEGGEIGQMMAALSDIPRILSSLVNDTTTLSDKIQSGYMRDRMNTSALSGSFAELANGVNQLSNAYTGILDIMPVPLMACNNEMQILYLNNLAQSAVGGNFVGDQCATHLKADSCNGEQCFGKCTMAHNNIYAGETNINPQDQHMNVSITAIPLRDKTNKPVGFIEIINDLTEIKQQQNTIYKVAHEASDISERVAAASEQLAAQVEQISRGAEMQRARVESTASAMTEMNATVLDVARNAGTASEQSQNTRLKAQEGAALVGKVVASINTVNKVATTMQENMQELGEQANGIGGVMNVISDIADQTNLLALNAAIEAARAGDAGRGFAVVADEVRKLAEKTMAATQEVARNIDAIQNSARVNIAEVANAARGITEATALANESGIALQEIVSLASTSSEVVTSIATAAEEQSATSEEISQALEEINHIVGETTDGMVQSSNAVQDLSRTAQQLRVVMDGLK